MMFRAELLNEANVVVMRLQGQLSGDYAEHARALVLRYNADLPLLVDLTDVTNIDTRGEEVLAFFAGFGAEFIADNAYSRYLCERLQLPLAPTARAGAHRNGNNRNAKS